MACGAGVGSIAAWKARGAMTHKGKVVVDQQGRVMGKDGKLLRDKKTGNFVYIDKDVKNKKKAQGPAADSGETHRKNAKAHRKISTTSKIPFSKKNAAPVAASAGGGKMSADVMSAWANATTGKENKAV